MKSVPQSMYPYSRLSGVAKLLVFLTLSGCYVKDSGQIRLGNSLNEIDYQPLEQSWLVNPNQDILSIESNPFRSSALSGASKWEIYSWVLAANDERAMVGVYLWATALAKQPNGENQYYTGRALEALAQSSLPPASEFESINELAKTAYRNVLDQFPDDVTYSGQGQPISLATLSYISLIYLGGNIPSGWTLIETDKGPKAIKE